jgi:hypothetical protein
MDTQEVLQIIDAELERTLESYKSAAITERLRNECNSGNEEERYEGVNLAVEIFKLTYLQGKEDCIDYLNNRKSSINPQREAFLNGYNFVCQIVNQWEI